MYLSTILAIVSSAGLATAHPFSLSTRAVEQFPAGTSWDILLNEGTSIANVRKVVDDSFQVIDIDLFDTSKESITDMKSSKKVICYFSAGSQEGWRSDSQEFKDGDVGQALDGWPDEKWVNVKSENVRNIMKKRIKKAADNGCAAIDPDNVDGFDGGQDGFGYDKSAYVDYVKFMAKEAENNGLAIGLKNAVDLIPDVIDVMQFAVNEQCHEFGECERYKPFTDANKAVFNIEYGGTSCDSPSGVKLSTLIKPEDQGLDTLGGACAGQNEEPAPSPSASPLSVSSAPAPSQPAPSASASSRAVSSTPAPSQPTPSQPTPSPSSAALTQAPTPTATADGSQPMPTKPAPTPTGRPWNWVHRPWGCYWGKCRWGHW